MGIRKILTALGGLCLVATAVTGAADAAGAADAHGTEYLTITIVGHYQGAVVHGAVFTGAGRDVSHGEYEVLHLGGGTIRVNHPTGQAHFSQHVNRRTCYATFTERGRYTLSNGGGRFAGITGHGTYTGHFKTNLKRTHNGRCDLRTETYSVGVIHAHGPASS